ncbi:hypothetical protein T08_7671 [Trichinella sp. T8]|nr:hypothetical protein T08_7671 [Trichinella sp. T8]
MYTDIMKNIFLENFKISWAIDLLVLRGTTENLFWGRPRVYIKDMPLHTLIGWFHYKLNLDVMDAISKKDHVDSPFH